MRKLASFFGPVLGSVQGHVNHRELARAVVASGAGSAALALALAVLDAVSADAPAIFPRDAMLVAWLLGLIGDLVRRMGQGSTPAPALAPPAAIYRGAPVEPVPFFQPVEPFRPDPDR